MSQTQFSYRAIAVDGQPVEGTIQADDASHAAQLLIVRGWTSISILPPKPAPAMPGITLPAPAVALSAAELTQLAEHLELLTRSGLPLASGLRAVALEHPQKRLATALLEIAAQLEAGRTLDEALANQPQVQKGNLGRLIEAGLRTGTLPQVLTQLVDIERSSRELGRTMRQAVAYPVLVLVTLLMLALMVSLYILPGFKEMFRDYTHMDVATRFVLWFSGARLSLTIASGVGVIAIVWMLVRLVCKPGARWRMIERLPFVGPMVFWRSVSTWARLLGLFLEHGIPSPEALRMAAGGVRDANVAEASQRLATMTSSGHNLADSILVNRRLPASLAPLLRWGETANALPEALRTAGELFENRVRTRAVLLRIVLPPLVFIFVALATLAVWRILLAPLIDAIRMLSGGNVQW